MHVSRHYGPSGLPIATSFLISLVTQMLWWASPAEAQGFFQQLFGLSSSSPQVRSAPGASAPRQPLGGAPMRFQIPAEAFGSGRSLREISSGGREGTGSYTTMCVRMCDGYYFPISHRVPRGRFYRDADVCRTRCDMGEARLFYHSSSGEDMKSAVDLTGRAYARLPIAFMHRKTRVAGCGCRPEPWSVEAQGRHEGYAIAEGVLKRGTVVAGGSSSGQGTLSVVAGSYAEAPAQEHEVDDGASANTTVEASEAAKQLTDAVSDEGAASPSENPAVDAVSQAAATGLPSVMRKPKPAKRQVAASASSAKLAPSSARSKPTRMASAGGKLVWPGDPR